MEKKRFQLDLSERDIKRLDSLVSETEASSRAEVIRQAIRAYDFLTDIDPDTEIECENGKGEIVYRGKARFLRF